MQKSIKARLEALERAAEPEPMVFILEYVANWRDDGTPQVVERHIVSVPPRKPGDPFDWHGTITLLEGNDAQP